MLQKLNLTRPIVAFDIESTSAMPLTAKIIELGLIKIHPNGERETLLMYFNPGEPIPVEAIAIHGITDEQVVDKPLFKERAAEVVEFIAGADFLTFNGNSFDIPLLVEELKRGGITIDLAGVEFVDAGTLFKILAPRTLTAAVLTYLKRDHAGAHGAIADVTATIEVLEAMFTVHADELPLNVHELALKSNYGKKRLDLAGKFTYDKEDRVVFAFGKFKDVPVDRDAETRGFLNWMLSKDFTEDTKNVAYFLYHGHEYSPVKPTLI